MPVSARWRLAARYANGYHPWSGGLFFGAVFAVLTWIAPTTPTVFADVAALSGLPVVLVAVAAGFAVGAVITPLVELARYYWRAPLRLVEDLEERVASLEEARATRPAARVKFEYDPGTHEVRLHVTNAGGPADFCAPLTVHGPLASPLEPATFATWEHTDRPWTRIAKSQSRTIRVAQLDVTSAPFAQWRLFVSAEGKRAFDVRAMHASVVGGGEEKHAPALIVAVSIVSVPEQLTDVRPYTITLHPFSAEQQV